MSFNLYKWVMSLLKIDKTKGKEFVLDSITMQWKIFRSFQGVNVLTVFLRFYENLRNLSVKHKCMKMTMLIQKGFQLICDMPKDSKGSFTTYVDKSRVVLEMSTVSGIQIFSYFSKGIPSKISTGGG